MCLLKSVCFLWSVRFGVELFVAWWAVWVASRSPVTQTCPSSPLSWSGLSLVPQRGTSRSGLDCFWHETNRNVQRERIPLTLSSLSPPPARPCLRPPLCPGWISSAPAEGVWYLTENIRTLLRSHNYQQWNWWDNQTPGGSRGARVHSPSVGPRVLGLLGLSPATWHIPGSHLIHGNASLLSALCQQVVVPRDYLVVVWPTFIIIVMSE